MAAFRFALEKVLEHRRRLVDLKSRDLAAARAAAAAVARQIAEVRARQSACAGAGTPAAAADVRLMAARTAWVARLDMVAAGLEEERREALARVAAAQEALQAAWRDREVIEQLRDRRRREWELAERRRETAELDEIGGRRHARAPATGIAG